MKDIVKEGLSGFKSFINDDEYYSGFDTLDAKYLTPKITSKAHGIIEGKLSHFKDFDLFVQLATNNKEEWNLIKQHKSDSENGLKSTSFGPKEEKQLFDLICSRNNLNPTRTIIYIKYKSSGDVVTPWMLMHTLSHAIHEKIPQYYPKMLSEFQDLIRKFFQKAEGGVRIPDLNLFRSTLVMDFLKGIFQFRSATRNVSRYTTYRPPFSAATSPEELFLDMLPEYLWHKGRIRRPSNESLFELIEKNVELTSDRVAKELTETLSELVDDYMFWLQMHIEKTLKSLIGHILLD